MKDKKTLRAVFNVGVAAVFSVTLLGISACASTAVTVSPTPVKAARGSEVRIAGSGFKPQQRLEVRIVMGGVLTDISDSLKPKPVANESGEFASTWKMGRESKLLEPGTHTITVVDEDGKTLGTAPVVFEKVEKKAKKK